MSVGANPTGIAPKIAPPPPKVQAPNTSTDGPRANAMRNATAPANASAPTAVVATAAPVSAPVGGTTSPAPAGPGTQTQAAAPRAQVAAQAIGTAFQFPGALAAMGMIAAVVTKTRKAGMGDAQEDSGDVDLETESEIQPDALQEADQEQGAGEITEAGSMSGPAT